MKWLVSTVGDAMSWSILARISEAEASFPEIFISREAFARHLFEVLRGGVGDPMPPNDVRDALAKLHVTDLYLAFACAEGSSAAQRSFDDRFLSTIGSHLRAVDGSESFADEVRQELRRKFFVTSESGPAKIRAYTGRGPLGGWVRVAAIRTARNLKRGNKPKVDMSDEQLGGLLAVDTSSPELAYLKSHSARLFRDVFEAVLKSLSVREQAILRLTYVERASSGDIGRIYGVTGAAVRVWLKKARDEVARRVKERLGAQLSDATDELHELVGLIDSRFELTLSRVLDEADGS